MLAFSKLISATMMPSGLRSILVGGVAAVLGAVLLASPATAQGSAPQDLGSVLASQQNLSTYYNLIKVRTASRWAGGGGVGARSGCS